MKNKWLIVFFLILSVSVFADQYKLTNEFLAPFPSQPTYLGESSYGPLTVRAYSYTDEINNIIFTATYPTTRVKYVPSDVNQILLDHVKGSLGIYTNARLIQVQRTRKNNHESILFEARYEINNLPGIHFRKFGIAVYAHRGIYRWTVTDIPGRSTMDAKQIFDNYLSSVLVK